MNTHRARTNRLTQVELLDDPLCTLAGYRRSSMPEQCPIATCRYHAATSGGHVPGYSTCYLRVMEGFLGLPGPGGSHDDGMTLIDIGGVIGTSRERVRQIEKEAMTRLSAEVRPPLLSKATVLAAAANGPQTTIELAARVGRSDGAGQKRTGAICARLRGLGLLLSTPVTKGFSWALSDAGEQAVRHGKERVA